MYDLNKIAECINDLNKINQEDLDVFKKLADEHSYSPVFSILYLKALSKFNPLAFEKVLKSYAYVIPSRKKLYELINEAKIEADISPETTEKDITSPVVHQNKIEESAIDKKEIETKEINDESTVVLDQENPVEQVSNEETISEEKEVSDDKIEPIDHEVDESREIPEEKEPEENTKQEKGRESHQLSDYDALERDILAHAVGASISLEVDTFFNEDAEESEEALSQDKMIIDQADETKEVTEQERDLDYAQSRSFTEWLSIGSENEQINEPIENKKEEKKKKIQLEKFEVKEPKTFFSASQKAKESLDYSNIPITETLAKIYDAQGNFPRALEAYEQLILKIPEKKVFFALQIEKLKKKINK